MRAAPPNRRSTHSRNVASNSKRSTWYSGSAISFAALGQLRLVHANSTLNRTPGGPVHRRSYSSRCLLLVALFLTRRSSPQRETRSVPPAANPVVNQIYSGDLTGAIDGSHHFQQEHPDHPLGYLLEAETLWWKIWCTSAEFRYGMSYPRHRAKLPADQHYLDLAAKASRSPRPTSPHGARPPRKCNSTRAWATRSWHASTACAEKRAMPPRAGVRARERLLRAMAIDPDLADADIGLGLYNYYADTLSVMARVLRFFMGIPGGSKEEGIRSWSAPSTKGFLLRPKLASTWRSVFTTTIRSTSKPYEVSAPACGKISDESALPAHPR